MNNFLYFVTCLYQYLVDNVLKIFVCSVLGLSFFYIYVFSLLATGALCFNSRTVFATTMYVE